MRRELPRHGGRDRVKDQAMKPFTTLAALLLGIIAVVHLARVFAGWEVIVDEWVIPVWASLPAVVIAGGVAVMTLREARS